MRRVGILLLFLFILLVIAAAWWVRGTSAVNPNDKSAKIFVIEQGQGVRAVAKNLKDQGLIKDQVVFFLLTKQMGIDSKIQAGSYRLFPSMTASQIAQEFTHGTLDIWVTVPEGQRAGEIAETLAKVMPEYEVSWNEVLEENEGYLFPDTYLFPKDADIDTILSIMKGNFDNKYAEIDTSNTNMSQEEIVILASLIEREARHDQDRPIVAGVIVNRINEGMALQVDASIQYAKGKTNGKWWFPITQAEYTSVNSPYNTYLNPGLPPGPIANPGLESLKAAANPQETDYLFYITDQNGVNRYGRTLAEHEANIRRYGLSN